MNSKRHRKYIVCPDSFKGSLTASEAADAMMAGIRETDASAEICSLPLADGGEGTASILARLTGAVSHSFRTVGPMGEPLKGVWYEYLADDGKYAIMDVATAAGLTLVAPGRRNIMLASSFGVGLMMKKALSHGVKNFIIGLGGSATNDGGLGILGALGTKLYDDSHCQLPGDGDSLCNIADIEFPEDVRFDDIRVTLLCDVDNPFYGPLGAAHVFARQKGANEKEIVRLDEGLKRLGNILLRKTGRDVSMLAGAGAAGGIGGMFMAVFSAEMKPGIDFLLDIVSFDKLAGDADYVLTGEGKIDSQTLHGKALAGIARRIGGASGSRARLFGFCGILDADVVPEMRKAGFAEVVCINKEGMEPEECMRREIAIANLRDSVKRVLLTEV